MRFVALFKNLSVQLLLILTAVILWGSYVPLEYKDLFYSISLNIRVLLMLSLPLIVSVSLMNCLISQQGQALTFVVLLFAVVTVSNFLTTWVAYGFGSFGLQLFETPAQTGGAGAVHSAVTALWNLGDYLQGPWLQFYRNEYALMVGVLVGLFFAARPNPKAGRIIHQANQWIGLFLERCFSPLLPLFAFGLILKMQADGILTKVVDAYLPMSLIIILVISVYTILMFSLSAGFVWEKSKLYLRRAMPAGIMGFSTMSSLAAIPVSIKVAELNTQDPVLSRAIIPATASTHMIGDSIAIPIFAMALLYAAGKGIPSCFDYLNFSVWFVLYKFAVAAVPGGSILVMLPILESHLGLNDEMLTLITTLYILFDPVVTAGNVMGNSAFVIFFQKIFKALTQRRLAL